MKLIALFSTFLLSWFSGLVTPKTGGDPYTGCCGTKAVETTFGKTLIYVPNIFTPNADGLNDTFRPFYDENALKVTTFQVLTSEDKVLWENKKFSPENPFDGWLGYVAKDSAYTGLFKYNMTFVDKAGATKAISGTACSVHCKQKEKINITDKKQCFFPMQYQKDSVNHYSPIFLEIDCLSGE